jgi:hypothetical protein
MPVNYDDKGQRIIKPNIQHTFTKDELDHYVACARSVEYFALEAVKVFTVEKGITRMEMRDYQVRMMKAFERNSRNIILAPRQCGKSMTTGIYALHKALFTPPNRPVKIYILSNKEKSAKEFLDKIKITYEDLDPYLKKGVVKWNEKSVKFEDGSEIVIGATTIDSIRGSTVSLLILDEFAHIPPHIAHDFYEAAEPTVSTKGEMIIISTPKGTTGEFYKIYKNAEKNIGEFESFKVEWDEVPGRDEAFKEKKIKDRGMISFLQEYACSFIGSSVTLVEGTHLERIRGTLPESPILSTATMEYYQKCFSNHIYVFSVDVAKGVGADYSVIQIIDITDPKLSKQVAVFFDNFIDPFNLTKKIIELSKEWNNPYVIVEVNAYGDEVVRRLWNEYEYENLFYERRKNRKGHGVYADKRTKALGTSFFKKQVENKEILIQDDKTLAELEGFIELRPDIYGCEQGENSHDDRVMAFVWFSYFMESPYWKDLEPYVRGSDNTNSNSTDNTNSNSTDNNQNEDVFDPFIPIETVKNQEKDADGFVWNE